MSLRLDLLNGAQLGKRGNTMKAFGTRIAPQAAVSLFLFLAAVSARAQPNTNISEVDLHVCNKGAVPVEVVAAQKNEPPRRSESCTGTSMARPWLPGNASTFMEVPRGIRLTLDLALPMQKASGDQAKLPRCPILVSYVRWFHDQKILTGAAVALCAQKDETSYRTDGDLPANCTGLKYITDFSGHLIAPDARYGPLLPLTSALFFGQTAKIARDGLGDLGPCSYYLNISPSATNRELHAAQGTDSGADDAKADGGDSLGTQVLKALAKAAADERQKQAQRQAQVAAAAPPGGFARFEDGCNAFYRDPANARLSMSDATGWCACLSEQYRNLMTPEEEAKYANDYGCLFHAGIAQPWGYRTVQIRPSMASPSSGGR